MGFELIGGGTATVISTREQMHDTLGNLVAAMVSQRAFARAGQTQYARQEFDLAREHERTILDAFDACNERTIRMAEDASCGAGQDPIIAKYGMSLPVAMMQQWERCGRDQEAVFNFMRDVASLGLENAAIAMMRTAFQGELPEVLRSMLDDRDPTLKDKDDPSDTQIEWAFRRLRVLATTGERSDQVQACDSMIRGFCSLVVAANS